MNFESSSREGEMKKLVVAVLAIVAIAMFGATAQGAKAPESAALLKNVNVTAKDLSFTLSAKTAKRGIVVFKVTNQGALKHDFQIKGRKTKLLSRGQSATLRITFLRKGHYPYKCTVAGHAAGGMKGVFTIT
jgi:iron uptake system component EfeO